MTTIVDTDENSSDKISADAPAIEEVQTEIIHGDTNASPRDSVANSKRFSLMSLPSTKRQQLRIQRNQETAESFAQRLEKRERFLMRRSDFCKRIWDYVLLLTTLTLLFLVPIHWSFLSSFIRPCHHDGDSFAGLEEFAAMRIISLSVICFCSTILVIEIFLSFFTPFFDESLSLEVIRLSEIAQHYLRFYFWKDVLAAFPWSLCFFFVQMWGGIRGV